MSGILLLIGLLSASHSHAQNRLPPPLEAKNCETTAPAYERPNDRFGRSGGHTTRAKVRLQRGGLAVDNVEQGRDLSRYEKLELVSPRPMGAVDMKNDPTLAQARTFLWKHWHDRKQAYLIVTLSSVDATSTSHIFVEQDDSGRWRVSWRIVRDHDEIDDLPTYYSVEWVVPAGWRKSGSPLPHDVEPDPMKHQLEFRDKCGDAEQSF